ncbi:MAG: hypothetical protein JXR97_16590, partial [Planctomycetes bacterium]|nr:hypothetical protein [Planctomycetota bacterium]
VKRASPGAVYVAPEGEATKPGESLPLPGDAAKVKEYYGRLKQLKQDVDALQEYLKKDEPTPGDMAANKERLKELARINGYLSLSANEVLSRHPLWLIKELEFRDFKLHEALPTVIVNGKNISSRPSLVEEPMSITALPDKEALKEIGGGGIIDKAKESVGGTIKGLFSK